MSFSWVTLAAALESPQGSTFYALLCLLLISATSLWLQQQAKPGSLARGISYTLAVLMLLRLVEALAFGAAWSGSAAAVQAMAPLERGLQLITLLALVWLWTQPSDERDRRAPLIFGAALLAALVMAWALFAPWLKNPAAVNFNYTDADYGWSAVSIVALLFGMVRVVKASRTTGLITFGILLLGQAAHMLLAEPNGNMPLATQAAHLIILPLLFVLPVHLHAAKGKPPEKAAPDERSAGKREAKDEGIEQTPSGSSTDELARSLANEMGADLCVFATVDEVRDEIELRSGYNVVRDAAIAPTRIELGELPRLRAALGSSHPLLLTAEERMPELGALSKALTLSFQANLLAVPLNVQDKAPWVLLLLSMENAWQPEQELQVVKSTVALSERLTAALGQQPKEMRPTPPAPVTLPTQLDQLEAENEHYRQDIEQLLAHIDDLERTSGSGAAMQSNELIQGIQLENERLKAALASGGLSSATSEGDEQVVQAREELRLALEEVARVHEDLEEARKAALAGGLAAPAAEPMTSHQVEVIASIAQELRQPLSSIVGYTDLILGESVGILGALQRKFLERVRSSTERMNTLIDNLIRIAELDQGGYSSTRKPVDLSTVIDDAIGLLRPTFQEKRIALRVDLPEHLPELNTDRDALQQILFHLLQNADAATPAEGEITLRAILDNQKELGDFVLIQVSDSGGGIPEDDLSRVFSRVYRASNPVIPGVGDTGVGLSIAETLTQALGGRIWVDSEAGVGATFSILLPLEPSKP